MTVAGGRPPSDRGPRPGRPPGPVPPEVTFSGVPAWLLATYLVELGGEEDEAGTVRGDGWTAKLVSRKAQVGSFAIGRVTVTIEGREGEGTMTALRKKAMRGGG